MTLKAAVFDFDLTLADSSPAVIRCVEHALATLGLRAADPVQVRRSIGLTLEATLEFLTGETNRSTQQRFRELFIEEADRVMVAQTELVVGLLPALERLETRGLKLGIVSTKFRYRIEAILERHEAGHYFECVVGGEDTSSHKPDPEGLVRALTLLKVDPHDAIYVGDHVVDAEAATRAAVPFVGVLTGNTTEAEFRGFPSRAILPSVADLPVALGM